MEGKRRLAILHQRPVTAYAVKVAFFVRCSFVPPSAKVKPWFSALSSVYIGSNYIKTFSFADIFDVRHKKHYFTYYLPYFHKFLTINMIVFWSAHAAPAFTALSRKLSESCRTCRNT
jgi:hypothetical protein